MAQILYASGDVKNVEPQNGTDFQLDELKKSSAGTLKLFTLATSKLIGLPFNILATEAYRMATQPNNETIVGDVLICDVGQVK